MIREGKRGVWGSRASTWKSVQRYQEVTRFPRSRLSKMHLQGDSRPRRCTPPSRYVPNDPPIRRCLEGRDERDSASGERARDIELIKNCNYRANSRIISAVM